MSYRSFYLITSTFYNDFFFLMKFSKKCRQFRCKFYNNIYIYSMQELFLSR